MRRFDLTGRTLAGLLALGLILGSTPGAQAAEDGKAGIFCVVLGFAIMMALDVALG